jgi:hypothetical protein
MKYILLTLVTALFFGCHQKASQMETSSDTIATISAVNEEYHDAPVATPAPVLSRYDSIYDYNHYAGMLHGNVRAEGNATLLFYGYMDYEEEKIKIGDVFTAVLPGTAFDDLMMFRTTPITAIYDTTNKSVNFPLIYDEREQPLFMVGVYPSIRLKAGISIMASLCQEIL